METLEPKPCRAVMFFPVWSLMSWKVVVVERQTEWRQTEMPRKETMMSKTEEGHDSRGQKGRVQVGTLQPQEKELKNHEAESVKGGGGARVGVVERTTIGEEIPS